MNAELYQLMLKALQTEKPQFDFLKIVVEWRNDGKSEKEATKLVTEFWHALEEQRGLSTKESETILCVLDCICGNIPQNNYIYAKDFNPDSFLKNAQTWNQ